VKKALVIIVFLTSILFGQEFKIVKYGETNKTMLLGTTTRDAYQDSNFSWWFNSEYNNYNLDSTIINNYKNNFEGKTIKIVLGTWCSDSRREVPRVIKILDTINFPEDKYTFINVDLDKKGLTDEVENLDIEFVPTIIIYEDGEELGRIIEIPEISLEKDLVKIIN